MRKTPRRFLRAVVVGSCIGLWLAPNERARAADAAPDPAFAGNGLAIHAWPTVDTLQAATTAGAVAADGSVIAGGQLGCSAGQPHFAVTLLRWIDPDGAADSHFLAARLLRGGTLDATSDGNGVRQLAIPIDTNTCARSWAIALSGGRQVLAGSLFDAVGTRYASGVARLQAERIFASGFEP